MTYYSSGRLHTMTDPRSNLTTLSYDSVGRLQKIDQPDGYQVQMALNAVNRLVALTSPNGNLSDVSQINLRGAVNHLKNPSFEENNFNAVVNNPTPYSRFWPDGAGHLPSTVAHSGTKSNSINNAHRTQSNIPSYQGARYLANYWVQKDADGVAASSWINYGYRDFKGAVQDLSGSPSAVYTLDGSNSDWHLATGLRIDAASDAQVTVLNPVLNYLQVQGKSENPPGTPVTTGHHLDDVGLYNLSTCFEYDGENLREVGMPDGARTRQDFDRFGRLTGLMDPVGRITVLKYDSLDRVISVKDAQGLTVSFQYDEVGNLTRFTDSRSIDTVYDYDELDRLKKITYTDTTTELFTYTAAGDLLTYTDNQGRARTMGYDFLHRLTGVTFSDSTTMSLNYDPVGNLLKLQDRSGNVFVYTYDDLYRPVGNTARSGSTALWNLGSTYDANSNRTSLDTDLPTYGTGVYGTSRYLVGTPHWSVPTGGYDSMDRLVHFLDRNSNSTTMDYDNEGRRTAIHYSNGTLTQAVYDIVGRLLQLTTTSGATQLLNLTYGYTLASERIAQFSNTDSFDYLMDSSGRLVGECINRLVQNSKPQFMQGDYNQLTFNDTTGKMELLSFNDSFAGTEVNLDRWFFQASSFENEFNLVGLEMHQNNGLSLVYPRGNSSRTALDNDVSVSDEFGYRDSAMLANIYHRTPLVGDFDVEVSFSDGQIYANDVGGLNLGITFDDPTAQYVNPLWVGRMEDYPKSFNYSFYGSSNVVAGGGVNQQNLSETASNLDHGRLRLTRVGLVIKGYYYNNATSAWVQPSTWTGSIDPLNSSLPLRIYVGLNSHWTLANFRLTNFQHHSTSTPQYPASAFYQSNIYDAGSTVNLNRLSWDQNVPSGTGLSFQIATSSSPSGPWTFVGPDGTAATSWTSSPATLPTSPHPSGRYFRYQATLTSTAGTATPGFSNVQISFSGTGSNTSTLMVYAYDNAGNITSKTTTTDSGTATDVRTPNSLNQITTQVVGGVTWTYTWNADGTLASKAGGGNTWAYTWDDVDGQRLLNVKLNSVTQIAFTYDTMGRMLTRTPYSGGVAGSTTSFTWDGWDCIKESSSTSTTRYYCPQGELQSFERDGVTYQVHTDALGSVRLVTDSTGAVKARLDYDAWGNLLPTSTDSVPGGMPYRYVGALGCRADATTGLIYMRQRWYDPQLQRFISRDPLRSANRYIYCNNSPTLFVDPLGLRPSLTIYVNPGGSQFWSSSWNATKLGVLANDLANQLNANVTIYLGSAPSGTQLGWGDNAFVSQIDLDISQQSDPDTLGYTPAGGPTSPIYLQSLHQFTKSKCDKNNNQGDFWSVLNTIKHELGHQLSGLPDNRDNDTGLRFRDGSEMDRRAPNTPAFFNSLLPYSPALRHEINVRLNNGPRPIFNGRSSPANDTALPGDL